MSRDGFLPERFKRALAHGGRGRKQIEDARKAIQDAAGAQRDAAQMQDAARRLHDEAHRQRDLERARRSGRRPLDAPAIAAAAIAVADAQGVEEVSMRKIAAVLGAGTMSLYHYLRTKEELLAAMDDLIMGEILVAPRALDTGWRAATTAIARSTRDAYRRHPWALTVQAKGRPGINGLRHVEQSLAALADTGLSFNDKMSFSIIVDDFVFGHSLRAREQRGEAERAASHELDMEGYVREIAAFMEPHLASGQFPQLRAAIGEDDPYDLVMKMAAANETETWFDTGLDALLDGLATRFKLNP